MQKIMDITDKPLKNIAYASGEVKGGAAEGLKSIEDIAFLNRLGNQSRISRDALGRNSTTLLNYTLNTYSLLGGYGKGLLTPGKRKDSARALATYFGMTAALGGSAAMIPEPVSALLAKYDPDFKEWEQENITPMGKLVQPGGIGGVGINMKLANRSWERFWRSTEKGVEALGEGDTTTFALELGDAGLSLSSFVRNPLGNPRVQKTLRNARDLYEEDIDQEEFNQKIKEAFMPFLKEQ